MEAVTKKYIMSRNGKSILVPAGEGIYREGGGGQRFTPHPGRPG